MGTVEVTWRLNVPEFLGLADVGLDDADVDAHGEVYVSDGLNGRVYKFRAGEGLLDVFSVIQPLCIAERECSLNVAVAADSTFCLADAHREVVIRYDEAGACIAEFAAPGVLSLCCGPDSTIYVLSSAEGVELINCYDEIGNLVNTLPAPARHRARLDPSLVNLESDSEGSIYVSYGMPPYRVWKVKADGSEVAAWGRRIEHPEDAVLIADIALDTQNSSDVLWVLLASKRFGRQMLDAFTPEGEFLGTLEIPHSDSMYGVVCASGGSDLCLLDTANGDLVRIAVSL
ncbi:MAG TPA: hypothetical protein VMX94_08435 [Armatimonadota bacterium]|nr:hypothetical protein [Armatimonadota bacterium]